MRLHVVVSGRKPGDAVSINYAEKMIDEGDLDIMIACYVDASNDVVKMGKGRCPTKGYTPGILKISKDSAGLQYNHFLPFAGVNLAGVTPTYYPTEEEWIEPTVTAPLVVEKEFVLDCSNSFYPLRYQGKKEQERVVDEASSSNAGQGGVSQVEVVPKVFDGEYFKPLAEDLASECGSVPQWQCPARQSDGLEGEGDDDFVVVCEADLEKFDDVFFTEAYGEEAPPVGAPTDLLAGFRSHTRWFGGKTEEDSAGAVPGVKSLIGGEWFGCFTPSWDRRLIEARDSVMRSTPMREGDVLYVRCRPTNIVRNRLIAGGAQKLEEIASVQCGEVVLVPRNVRAVTVCGREYTVANLGCRADVSGLGGRLRDFFLGKRHKMTRLALVDKPYVAIGPEAVKSFPDGAPKVRILGQMMKPLLAVNHPHVVGPLADARQEVMGKKDPSAYDVVEMTREAVALSDAVLAQLRAVPNYGHKPHRCHKSCVNCGRQPPDGKYRWKYRQCSDCQEKMDKLGYTTWSGYQVQENLQVPTCYPGIVYRRGEQHPPPQKKWDAVNTGEDLVKIRWHAANVIDGARSRGKKWDTFVKSDLQKLSRPNPPRFTHALAGIACSGASPMVSVPTPYTQGKALLARVFREVPPAPWGRGPKPGRWLWARQFVPFLLPEFRAAPMSFEDWLASMPTRRRRALQEAAERYDRVGWTKASSYFKAFVKTEFLPGFSQKDWDLWRLDEMVDRIINAPEDVTHVIAGRVLKPFLTRLKEIWTPLSFVFYASVSPEKLKIWLDQISEAEASYFWSDFVQFENSHSPDSWDFMEWLYGPQDGDFSKVMDAWRAPQGSIGPFKYKARVMNASGRDDTALANCVLNGFATSLSICAAYFQIPLDELTPQLLAEASSSMRLAVCGDDSLGMLPRWEPERLESFKAATSANLKEFGFNAKLESSNRLIDCVFLGMRPYPTQKGWYWGKTIGRCTYKMPWSLKPQQRDLMAQITGVADMHVRCSPHVPIVADIARKIVALRAGAKRTPVRTDDNKPWEWTLESGVMYDEVTLQAVADVYHTSVDEVHELITAINGVERLPAVIDSDLWRRIISIDEL
jgi:hypothetical protein